MWSAKVVVHKVLGIKSIPKSNSSYSIKIIEELIIGLKT